MPFTITTFEAALQKPGKHLDGDGLYLIVSRPGVGSWLYRYKFMGRERFMGLGSASTCSPRQARELADDARHSLRKGIDPVAQRHEARKVAKVEAARSKTFQEFADDFITLRSTTWKNAKHASQWSNTLRDYVYPVIGHLPLAEIKTEHIKQILLRRDPHAADPNATFWTTKTETASRVRGRIEVILDAAKVEGLREGENVARWRGHLEHILPKPGDIHQEENHAALKFEEIGAFMAELRARPALAARALEFTILTAVRTANTISATWGQIDLDKRLWTIPREAMKGTKAKAREHRVPLASRVIEILRERAAEQGKPQPSDRIFPLSNMAMLVLLQKRMGRAVTVHGFRATFRSWVSARFKHSIELSKKALAHASGDKVDDAYQREELIEERRPLMEAWAAYCGKRPAPRGDNVTVLRRA